MSSTSYQNIDNDLSDSQDLLEQQIIHNNTTKKSNNVWKYLLVITLIGVIGLVGYTYNITDKDVLNHYKVKLNFISNNFINNNNNIKSNKLSYSLLKDDEKLKLFNDFKNNFQKTYETAEEESNRFQNFLNNLNLADIRNAISMDAVHGITALSDLSEEEFIAKLGYKATSDIKLAYKPKTLSDYDVPLSKVSKLNGVVNWAGVLTTAVKDQGYCGSCWAFSAASQIESDSIRAGLISNSVSLSAEQIVECDNSAYQCNGGTTESAYFYVYTNGGIASTNNYPYSSYDGTSGICLPTLLDKQVSISDYYLLDSEETMKAHVLSTGPLSICIAASQWLTYTGGIMTAAECGDNVDHCVQVVGINQDENYWIIRNSWGTGWGEGGYIYVQYGENACAITNDPTYVDAIKV